MYYVRSIVNRSEFFTKKFIFLIFASIFLTACGVTTYHVKDIDKKFVGYSNYWKTATIADVKNQISNGANINAKGEYGSTPLHKAVVANTNPKIIKFLIISGANINAKGQYGSTLHYAARYNKNPEVIKMLIDEGANVLAKDRGKTPLHYAAESNKNPEVIKMLIDKGANVLAKSWAGYTPLHNAARSNKNPEVIKLLVAEGANINIKANSGKTPLIVAAGSHSSTLEIVKTLIDLGADVNASFGGGIGLTAIDAAKSERQTWINIKQENIRKGYTHEQYDELISQQNAKIQILQDNNVAENQSEYNAQVAEKDAKKRLASARLENLALALVGAALVVHNTKQQRKAEQAQQAAEQKRIARKKEKQAELLRQDAELRRQIQEQRNEKNRQHQLATAQQEQQQYAQRQRQVENQQQQQAERDRVQRQNEQRQQAERERQAQAERRRQAEINSRPPNYTHKWVAKKDDRVGSGGLGACRGVEVKNKTNKNILCYAKITYSELNVITLQSNSRTIQKTLGMRPYGKDSFYACTPAVVKTYKVSCKYDKFLN